MRWLKVFATYSLPVDNASSITGQGRYDIMPVSNNGTKTPDNYDNNDKNNPAVRIGSMKWKVFGISG
jgi:hypothetical protein